MVDCSACKHPEHLRQSFNDQHGAGGEFDEPVGGFAKDPVVERRMALEPGYEEIEAVPRDEGDNGRGRTTDDDVAHELYAVMLCFGLRLCHHVREFAISHLFLADDSREPACIQGISSTQIMCASALWEWASRNAATRALKAPSDPSLAIRIFLNMGGSSASEANAVFAHRP
jgi:hypothetical protein